MQSTTPHPTKAKTQAGGVGAPWNLYVALFKHLLKHEDLLNLSDAVINAWRQQLGHDAEDDEAGFP
jgi:hypothetical protein